MLYVSSLSWRTALPPVGLLTNPNPIFLSASKSISFFALWKYPTDSVAGTNLYTLMAGGKPYLNSAVSRASSIAMFIGPLFSPVSINLNIQIIVP